MRICQLWSRTVIPAAILLVAGVAAPSAWALDKYSANGANGIGLDNTGNEANARDNLNKITDAMVEIYQNGGGNIYFRPGTYCLDRPLRPLPGVNFKGIKWGAEIIPASEGEVTIKNVYTTTTKTDGAGYWNCPVIFGGCDHPEEGYYASSKGITFRSFPYAIYPQAGDTKIRVWNNTAGHPNDWDAVLEGEEIKIVSGSNGVLTQPPSVLPDYMIKARVHKSTSNPDGTVRYWLNLVDEQNQPVAIPWGMPSVAGNTAPPMQAMAYGSVGAGQPAWFIVRDYATTAPDYWLVAGNPGYTKYLALGQWENSQNGQIPANRWVKGWTSRNNKFWNLTLQSKCGHVMFRGMPSYSEFKECVFKGRSGMFGNSCQFTTFTSCKTYFWDVAGEFSYNSYGCTLTDNTFTYDSTLTPTPTANFPFDEDIGIFTIHERSSNIQFTAGAANIGVSFDLASGANDRTMSSTNAGLQISGADVTFSRLKMFLPQVSGGILQVRKDTDSNVPSTNITFAGVSGVSTFDMTGNNFGNLTYFVQYSNHITLKDISFANVSTTVADRNQIRLGSASPGDGSAPVNSPHHIFYDHVLMPNPGASNTGALVIQNSANFSAAEIYVDTDCRLMGFSNPNLRSGILNDPNNYIHIGATPQGW